MTRRTLALGLAASLLAACGGSVSGSDTSSSPARSRDGGTLRIALKSEAGDLNPYKYTGMWGVQAAIFEPLVRYGAKGKIEPALATSWRISDGGRRYVFKLRPNVRFTDGAPLNAKAVAWNFEHWIEDPHNIWMGVSRYFASDRVIDELTYELRLKRPFPGVLQELAYVRPSRMLSPRAADAKGEYEKPIGTGPWVLQSSDARRTVLVRNEDYWGEKPRVARLELEAIPDSQTRLSALRAGDVDVIRGDFTAPMTSRDVLTLRGAPNARVVTEPGSTSLVLAFNNRRPPMSDVAVRHAVSLAVDRQRIAKAIFAGLSAPSANLFPAAVPFSGERRAVAPANLGEANRILDAAGWTRQGDVRVKDGRPLELTLVASEEALASSRALSEVVQSQLAAIGARVKIKLLDHASKHDELPAGKYDLTFSLTEGAPYDPFGTLGDLFDSRKEVGTDGKIYSDPAFDKRIDAVLDATDDAERARAYEAAYRYLDEQWALLPLVVQPRLWAHSTNVRGFRLPSTEYELPWAGAWLAG